MSLQENRKKTGDRQIVAYVSRQTIWRMVKEGRLPTVETRLDRYRVPAAALTAFVTRAA